MVSLKVKESLFSWNVPLKNIFSSLNGIPSKSQDGSEPCLALHHLGVGCVDLVQGKLLNQAANASKLGESDSLFTVDWTS